MEGRSGEEDVSSAEPLQCQWGVSELATPLQLLGQIREILSEEEEREGKRGDGPQLCAAHSYNGRGVLEREQYSRGTRCSAGGSQPEAEAHRQQRDSDWLSSRRES